MSFQEIMKKREKAEKVIQNNYDNLNDYKQKILYIYNILLQSQNLFLKYINISTLYEQSILYK